MPWTPGVTVLGPRYWSTAFWHPTGAAVAFLTGVGGDPNTWTDVEVWIDGVLVDNLTALEPTRWIRGAANPAGDYVLVSEGSSGQLQTYDSATTTWALNGATFSQRQVSVAWDGTNFIIIAQSSSTQYRRIIFGVSEVTLPIGFATADGLLGFTPGAGPGQDAIRWTLTSSPLISGGVQINFPAFANGVYMGQGQAGGTPAFLANGDRAYIPQGSFDPNLAYAGGLWVYTSWIGSPENVLGVFPPWPGLTPGTPVPPPVPPPTGGGIFAPSVRRGTALARTVERELPRLYHETDQIPDPHTQRMGRLLWDRTYDIGDQIKAVDAKVAGYDTALAALQAEVESVRQLALIAQSSAGKLVSNDASGPPLGGGAQPRPPGSEPLPPGGTTPPGDQGDIQTGFYGAGPTGHVTAGSPPDFTTAGMVIRGTGNEFPALLAATVDLPTREANAEELLGRIIWHLQQAGIPAGRQRNPSGAISKDKLTLQVVGGWYAYDVFLDFDAFADPMVMIVHEVFPANTVADGGIPD